MRGYPLVFPRTLARQVKQMHEPASFKLSTEDTLTSHWSFTWRNNMADESKESCSFHDMGLDDRLVKVNVIPVVEVNQECLL